MIKKLLTDFNVTEHFEFCILAYFLYDSLEGTESIIGQNIHVDSGTI